MLDKMLFGLPPSYTYHDGSAGERVDLCPETSALVDGQRVIIARTDTTGTFGACGVNFNGYPTGFGCAICFM
eukprot:SAG25_NODE_1489_length_2913_cov_2.241649_2_plen_72_part_00